MATAPTFHPSSAAFQGAIDDGHLTDDPASPLCAGAYMYMGTVTVDPANNNGFLHRDLFKHRISRKYIEVPCTWSDMSFSS